MSVIKVREATGAVLDYLVAQADGVFDIGCYGGARTLDGKLHLLDNYGGVFNAPYNPSEHWNIGGPIIEREIGNLWKHNKLNPTEPDVWTAAAYHKAPDGTLLYHEDGPTPLIAAMRCFCVSKLGEEVEVPEELL